MPSISTLLREKETLMEKYPQRFYGDVAKQQERMYRQIDDLLRQLQFDENGNLLTNEFNVGVSDRIIQRLNTLFYNEDYLDAVNTYMSGFDKSVELNDGWLKSLGVENVTDITTNAKVAMTTMKRNSTNLLVGQSAINSSFFAPIKQTLDDAVTNRMGMRELDKAIRTTIVGNDQVDGRLLSYSKQIANDAIATGDRNYSALSAEDAGVEFYKYTGGLISDSRSFCKSRNDKFFHHKEIAEWGHKPETWSGRFRNTNDANIFTWLGGYNCKHSIIPVSEISVPKDVLERAMAKGYYKPSEAVMERLGIEKPKPIRKKSEWQPTQETYDEAVGYSINDKKWNKNKFEEDRFWNAEWDPESHKYETDNYAQDVPISSYREAMKIDKRHGIIKNQYDYLDDPDNYQADVIFLKRKDGKFRMENTMGWFDGESVHVAVNKKGQLKDYLDVIDYDELEKFYKKASSRGVRLSNSDNVLDWSIDSGLLTDDDFAPYASGMIYTHERAHFITGSWNPIIEKTMGKYGLDLDDSITEYGRVSPDEFFAESFTMFDVSPKLMEKYKPKLFKFVTDILKSSKLDTIQR